MASFSSRQRLRSARAAAGPEMRPEFLSLLVQATARTNHQHHHQHLHQHLHHLQQQQQQQAKQGPAPRGTENIAARRESMNLPESDCMRLNPSLRGIAFRSLVAVDLSASRGMVAWCGSRQMLRVLGVTGHGAAWLAGTAYCLWRSDSPAGREVLLNLMLALIFDIIVAVTIKGLVRRKGPSYCEPASAAGAGHHPPARGSAHGGPPSCPGLFAGPASPSSPSSAAASFRNGGRSAGGGGGGGAASRLPPFLRRGLEASAFSFPANQATRAALLALFLPRHLLLGFPLRVLLLLWALLVGLLRVALGQHYLTDVLCGFAIGCAESRAVEALWMSGATCQAIARAVGL